MVTLLLAIPVLLAGATAWWVMQQRSPDGAFHADLAPIEAPSRIVVVADVDAVLRRDAPIARADETLLRIRTEGFIGIAEPGDVAAYLAGAGYTELQGVKLGRGPLSLTAKHFSGTAAVAPRPGERNFWLRRGAGELSWRPALDRDRQVTLVIVAPPGTEPVRVEVAVTAGWLNSTAWGLLILGPVLLLLGLAALAWPQRPREIVYVMDPAAAMQAGLPSAPNAQFPPVNVAYQPIRSYTPPVQSNPPPAQLPWPPAEPAEETSPANEVPDTRPMPVAGVHLHITQRAATAANVDE